MILDNPSSEDCLATIAGPVGSILLSSAQFTTDDTWDVAHLPMDARDCLAIFNLFVLVGVFLGLGLNFYFLGPRRPVLKGKR